MVAAQDFSALRGDRTVMRSFVTPLSRRLLKAVDNLADCHVMVPDQLYGTGIPGPGDKAAIRGRVSIAVSSATGLLFLRLVVRIEEHPSPINLSNAL